MARAERKEIKIIGVVSKAEGVVPTIDFGDGFYSKGVYEIMRNKMGGTGFMNALPGFETVLIEDRNYVEHRTKAAVQRILGWKIRK